MGKDSISRSEKLIGRRLRIGFILACTIWCIVVCGFPSIVSAEVFESQFLRFSLPEGWKCDLEGAEYTCEPPHAKGQKLYAIFVLAAKLPGASDNLPSYMEELRKNRSVTHGSSLVDGPKISEIGGVSWIEATHFESEIPNYYTIYMATVKDGLGILVTFSARKSDFAQFKDLIRPCVQSLEVKKNWRGSSTEKTHK